MTPTKQALLAEFELDVYDAGHLSDYGGGNVAWWQDYIRAELGRAFEFYQYQHKGALDRAERDTWERARDGAQSDKEFERITDSARMDGHDLANPEDK